MDGVSGTQHQEYSNVFLGSNFTISCSIQSQYPGGIFQLTFNSSRTMHSYIQPAVNHSTTFLFPAAEPAHQGSYSCVYQVYVSSHDFSSESHQLSLTVTGEREEYQPCDWCGQQHDNADLQQLEQVPQHHLQPIRDHAVNGIDLFGETVQEVSTGGHLKEGHGRMQDTVQKIGMKMA
ncbi:hypothetical protein INR49_021958 [Caranx melampygus]|nr:hypothetical protein INR49_021958 [Caranx melampygus]